MGLHSDSTHEFIKLLTGHQSSLRAFILSLLPGSDDIDDILQDTNVVLWEKMDSFELGTNFQAWAFTVARNMVKAQLRSTKRNQSPSLNPDIIEAISQTWYQSETSSTMKKQRALDACMDKLNDKERNLIQTRYSNTVSLENQAQLLGRSSGSLRVSLFRIREKLRQCVQKRVALMEGGAA